ncbi:MAG: hypothetical protein ACR2PS_02315, partial [Pseudomonadales bacterium]
LSSEGQQKSPSVRTDRSSTYRISNGSRVTRSSRVPTPAPRNIPRPEPRPTPTAAPRPAPTPIAMPAPRRAPAPQPAAVPEPGPVEMIPEIPEPIAEAPVPAPEPEPEPQPPEPEPKVVIGSANLSWTIPTKRENGDDLPLSELRRYEVYYTSDSGKSDTIKINDASRTKLTVNNLEVDTYYFAMSAVDKDGIFSELSNEVPKTIK